LGELERCLPLLEIADDGLMGCPSTMVASGSARLAQLRALGIGAIDRGAFQHEDFEREFLRAVLEETGGEGVSIFVDNIGAAFRTTLKALARQGVITTSGWKHGATFPVLRSMECISRHIHVHTHYARYSEGLSAVNFAAEHGWLPPIEDAAYAWEDIPKLAEDYREARVDSYFPIFAVNPI
jgi:NADPH:quinone reductase-like Zn-dependent oxidoreductase